LDHRVDYTFEAAPQQRACADVRVLNPVCSATGNTVKHVLVAGDHDVGRLVRIAQDEVMRGLVAAGERITGRLNLKVVKLTARRVTPCAVIADGTQPFRMASFSWPTGVAGT